MKKVNWFITVVLSIFIAAGVLAIVFFGHSARKPDVSKGPQIKKNDVARITDKPRPSEPELAGGQERKHRNMPRVRIIRLKQKYPDLILYEGSSTEKKVALTFDDGPDKYYTPQILNVLKQENVHATFFVVGTRIKANPAVLKRIVGEGHIVGNHSWDHAFMDKLKQAGRYTEIKQDEDEIFSITGLRTKLFRPPYGAINEALVEQLQGMGYKIIEWSVDTLDWTGLPARPIVAGIISHTENGSIILQHSAGGRGENLRGTVRALPEIIKRLRAEGFTFVTVPELLNIEPYANPKPETEVDNLKSIR